MPNFTITQVLGNREWSPPPEPGKTTPTFVFYDILFEGAQGRADDPSKPASWKTLKGEDAPAEGETVEAEIVHKNGKVELKRPKKGGGWNGGGGAPRQRDPLETKRIVRQHSQKIALMYIQAKVAAGEKLVSKSDPSKPFTFEEVRALTDRFQADIEGVS